jgi:hypothetical protein
MRGFGFTSFSLIIAIDKLISPYVMVISTGRRIGERMHDATMTPKPRRD